MKLERAVRLELTNTGVAIRRLSRLATRAYLCFVLRTLFFDVFANETNSPKSSKHKVQSTDLCYLERKERFELSKRVWKTRMFPATSLPQKLGTPGRTRTRNLDVRSVALFQLSYRSGGNFGLRIADLSWSIVPDSNRCLSAGNAVS